jgi:C1A family cysteine protease
MEDKVTVAHCIRALNSNGAVIVTFECFESAKAAEKGIIKAPTPGEKKLGAHAVALYDHDPETKCFYFRNSWGPEWGDRGHGALTYEFIESGYVTKLTVLG